MKCPHCNGTGELSDPKPAEINLTNAVQSIIAELNRQAGTNYRANTAKARKHISARINEGFRVEDFARVITTKCKAWLHDPRMRPFLRPETLFGPKFESYLNEDVQPPKRKPELVY